MQRSTVRARAVLSITGATRLIDGQHPDAFSRTGIDKEVLNTDTIKPKKKKTRSSVCVDGIPKALNLSL